MTEILFYFYEELVSSAQSFHTFSLPDERHKLKVCCAVVCETVDPKLRVFHT